MNLSCNIKTAVISMAVVSAFGAGLSVSISAYGVSKYSSNDMYAIDHSFSMFAVQKTNISFPLIRREVGNVVFSEDFAYILNE